MDYNVIDDDMCKLEKILHATKVNYNTLNSILNTLKHTPKLLENKDTINIFIDLKSILRQLYKDDVQVMLTNINQVDRFMLVSEIINIVAHYRNYFFTRFGKYTNIIMYYTTEESKYCKEINPEYNSHFYNKSLGGSNKDKPANSIILNTIEMVKNYLAYIPHAYVINTKTVDPRAFVRYYVDNQDDNQYSLIITNDDLYLEMLNENRDRSILKVHGENSKNIYKGNIYSYLTSKLKRLPEYPGNNLVGLILSYMGSKEHNITYNDKLGPARAMSKVNKLIESQTIQVNTEYSVDVLSNLIQDEQLISNYSIINSKNLSKNISSAEHLFIENQFIDMNNFEEIQKVNNYYFKRNSVLIDFLYRGETVI